MTNPTTAHLSTAKRAATIWSLEMRSRSDLRPAVVTSMQMKKLEKQALYRQFLWMIVGGPWSWGDRRSWTGDQWSALAEDPSVHTWVGYLEGNPVGFLNSMTMTAISRSRSSA